MTDPLRVRSSAPQETSNKQASGQIEKPSEAALQAIHSEKSVSQPKKVTYSTNWLQNIVLKVAMSSAVFGSFRALSPDTIPQEYADLPGLTVAIAYGDQHLLGRQFGNQENAPVALLFSGSFRPAGGYMVPTIEAYLEEGYNVLVVDPVGFGENQQLGRPDPENFMKSAEAAADYVRNEMQSDTSKVVVHGFSLGGFAATHVAALEENSGMHVVLDRVASSTEKIASCGVKGVLSGTLGKILGYIAGKITKFAVPFDLEKEIDQVKGKVLVVQADSSDEINPNDESAEKLLQTRATIKKVHEVGSHIDNLWIQNKTSSHEFWQNWLKKDITQK